MDNKIAKYISILSNSRINKNALITEVLSRCTLQELETFGKRTPKIFHGLLRIPYLKRKQYSDIFETGRVLLRDTVDIYGAIAFVILNNVEAINRYVELKLKLDESTAVKKYDDSYRIINQIDTEVSASMTITYYLLKLTRLDKGTTVCTQLHNKICNENRILSYIAGVAFKSASIDLPFEAEIEKMYRSLGGDTDIKDFFTAFAFPYKVLRGDGWLRMLLYTSIIDLYEGFLLQLSKLPIETLKEDSIKKIVSYLAERIHDRRIQRLHSLLHNGGVLDTKYHEAIDIIEDYYSENYENVLSKGQVYLAVHPLESTIVDIFYRSCIKLDRFPELSFPEDSLAGHVHNLFLMSLMNDDVSAICSAQLRNICMAWYAIPGLRHLFQIFQDLENRRSGSVYMNFWRQSLLPELRDASFFPSTNDAVNYLESSGYERNKSSQISILEGKQVDKFNQSLRLIKGFSDDEIPIIRKDIEEGETLPVLIGVITSRLFDRLMQSGSFSEAISAYVKCRIDNQYAKIQIDRAFISKALTDAEDNKISSQLELSAFYTMINADVYKRYLAYKRYLRQIGVKRASGIRDLSQSLLQFFIGKVVDRNVLTLHVTEFETDEDVVAERIELCKKMYYISNDKAYSDEITSLIKEQEVLALAQQVNDSKIHVDVQSLINNELGNEKLMFDTFSEIDDNLEMYEQKNMEGLIEFIKSQYEGKTVVVRYELPTVKYKRVLFRQMILSIRDKFLCDPRYGLDKYLSARIRHGTLITQLRNHFLTHNLVTNKKEGGEYVRINPWTQRRFGVLTDSNKEKINNRLLQFTEWLDAQLHDIKEEKIQIKTERYDGKPNGLFDYSEVLMMEMIDALEWKDYKSFEAFVHSALGLLWRWTEKVLQSIREYFQQYQEVVLNEMTNLQNDIVPLMQDAPNLAARFKDAITTCRTEFQSDVSIVSSWFKPERSTVRFFTIQQAVDTSLSVINKINQNALSFQDVSILDSGLYSGEFFNAFHDIFHDMMNNILDYETKRPGLKGMGRIKISNIDDILYIEVSNPIDSKDNEELRRVIQEQQDFPSLIAGGKTRKEGNSGCMKIYSTVMYTLGASNKYENSIENDSFIARIQIDSKLLKYNEDTTS